MPNLNVSFQGATLIVPGAYESDNVSGVVNNSNPTTPPLVIIGYGYGGKPQTMYSFASVSDWQNFVRGGPCAELAPFLSNPSPQLNGVQLINYVNVGENTQSSYTMPSVSGNAIVNFVSANYGSPSNLIQISGTPVLNGLGTDLTIYDGYSGAIYESTNTGVPFWVAYDGVQASASLTITDPLNTGAASYLTISSATSSEHIKIPLGPAGYATVGDVVNYLNGTGVYVAQVYGDGTLPSQLLDLVTTPITLPAPSGGNYVQEYITAAIGDTVYWSNQYAGGLLTASAVASGAPVAGTLFGSIVNTHFSGAVSIPPVTQDYANGFNVALNYPGWVVIADTGATAVQALGAQHAETASTIPNKSYRRFFTGSSLGDSITQTLAKAAAITGITQSYFYPGIQAVNTTTGDTVTYPGYIAAAAAAAMATGNAVATPLTNKELNATGVEVPLTISQINTLQQGGVSPIAVPQATGVPTIISDFTTWLADNNPENCFTQQIACRFWLAYSLNNTLQNYIGTIASTVTELAILNAVKALLNSLVYTVGNNGVINSWDSSTLSLTYTGTNQVAAITVSVQLVGQNRFITVYVPIQALSITITSAST